MKSNVLKYYFGVNINENVPSEIQKLQAILVVNKFPPSNAEKGKDYNNFKKLIIIS